MFELGEIGNISFFVDSAQDLVDNATRELNGLTQIFDMLCGKFPGFKEAFLKSTGIHVDNLKSEMEFGEKSLTEIFKHLADVVWKYNYENDTHFKLSPPQPNGYPQHQAYEQLINELFQTNSIEEAIALVINYINVYVVGAIDSKLTDVCSTWDSESKFDLRNQVEGIISSTAEKSRDSLATASNNTQYLDTRKVYDTLYKCIACVSVALLAHESDHINNPAIQDLLQPLYDTYNSLAIIAQNSKFNNPETNKELTDKLFQQANKDSLITSLSIINTYIIPDTIEELNKIINTLKETDPNSPDLKLFTTCLENLTALHENIKQVVSELEKSAEHTNDGPVA